MIVNETTINHTADRILRPREVSARIGLSLVTIWRLRRAGRFPAPIQLSPGALGWRESDIARWLSERSTAA